MGFGALRVLNEDAYAPGAALPPHPRANMELVEIVLSGTLACAGAKGEQQLVAGGVYWTGAGHGVAHATRNPDPDRPARALQAWLQPERLNATPASAARQFDPEARRGRWTGLLSPDGADGAIAIRLQAWLRARRLGADARTKLALDPARRYWCQVTHGEVHVGGERLAAGDGLGLEQRAGELVVQGIASCSDVLVFDLPG